MRACIGVVPRERQHRQRTRLHTRPIKGRKCFRGVVKHAVNLAPHPVAGHGRPPPPCSPASWQANRRNSTPSTAAGQPAGAQAWLANGAAALPQRVMTWVWTKLCGVDGRLAARFANLGAGSRRGIFGAYDEHGLCNSHPPKIPRRCPTTVLPDSDRGQILRRMPPVLSKLKLGEHGCREAAASICVHLRSSAVPPYGATSVDELKPYGTYGPIHRNSKTP
jgi:hypothetical protein